MACSNCSETLLPFVTVPTTAPFVTVLPPGIGFGASFGSITVYQSPSSTTHSATTMIDLRSMKIRFEPPTARFGTQAPLPRLWTLDFGLWTPWAARDHARTSPTDDTGKPASPPANSRELHHASSPPPLRNASKSAQTGTPLLSRTKRLSSATTSPDKPAP